MTVDSHENNHDFDKGDTTKELPDSLSAEEVTGNSTKRPLTYHEFTYRKNDPGTRNGIPVWLGFYLKLHKKWADKNCTEEPWLAKVEEAAPPIYKGVMDLIGLNEEFETAIRHLKLATNVHMLDRQIEPLLYEAYQVARRFVEDDKYLFGNETETKNETEKTPPLTFEEFCIWDDLLYEGKVVGKYPRYNNFAHRFLLWDPNNKKAGVIGMQKEIPELFKKISEIISDYFLQMDLYKGTPYEERINMKEPNIQEVLTAIQADLYQAYLVARKYTDDKELFW